MVARCSQMPKSTSKFLWFEKWLLDLIVRNLYGFKVIQNSCVFPLVGGQKFMKRSIFNPPI